jgi:hypothetical protein
MPGRSGPSGILQHLADDILRHRVVGVVDLFADERLELPTNTWKANTTPRKNTPNTAITNTKSNVPLPDDHRFIPVGESPGKRRIQSELPQRFTDLEDDADEAPVSPWREESSEQRTGGSGPPSQRHDHPPIRVHASDRLT